MFFNTIFFHQTNLGNGEIKSVVVSGCDGDVCTLKKGQTISATTTFTPSKCHNPFTKLKLTIFQNCMIDEDTTKGRLDVVVVYKGITIPLPNFDPDVCKHTSCPLKKGQDATVKYNYTLPSIIPVVSIDYNFFKNSYTILMTLYFFQFEVDITIKLIGDGEQQLMCATFHTKVTD